MINSITAFNQAVQKSNEWLKDLKDIGQFKDEEQSYTVLRSVLHAVRNRLIPDEAVHLGSELPMLIRGVYYEGFDIKNPSRHDDLKEFLTTIANEMRDASLTIEPQKAAQAVFTLLHARVSAGEMSDVINLLPSKIKKLLLTSDENI